MCKTRQAGLHRGHPLFHDESMIEPIFYRNPKGDLGLSLDEGETIWTHQGRNIPMTPVWEWTDEEDLETLLNPAQTKALQDARNAPSPTELDQLVRTFHKRQVAVQKDYYAPPPPPRRVRDTAIVVVSDLDD